MKVIREPESSEQYFHGNKERQAVFDKYLNDKQKALTAAQETAAQAERLNSEKEVSIEHKSNEL